MAMRNLLHKSKLEDFKIWLNENNKNCILKSKGSFEVLRWSSKGEMPIVFNGKSPCHYSCNEAAIPFVRRFITSQRKIKS